MCVCQVMSQMDAVVALHLNRLPDPHHRVGVAVLASLDALLTALYQVN